MTKLVSPLFLILSLFLLSCSNDDDNDWSDVTVDNIVGRWQLADVRVKTVNTNEPEITEELKIVNVERTPMIEFRYGGVYIDENGTEGSYYISENTIYIDHYNYRMEYENAKVNGNRLEYDMDIKDEIQQKMNSEYPYNTSNIIIYDYILTVGSIRK